jgi:hypothetical protein
VDSAEDDKPIVEVQDANLGVSYRFDSAKFTPEKAQQWVQKRTYKDCPVCKGKVGFLTAAQRLYNSMVLTFWKLLKVLYLPKRRCANR